MGLCLGSSGGLREVGVFLWARHLFRATLHTHAPARQHLHVFAEERRIQGYLGNSLPLGPYSRTMPRALWLTWGEGAVFF